MAKKSAPSVFKPFSHKKMLENRPNASKRSTYFFTHSYQKTDTEFSFQMPKNQVIVA